jgi:hypothetical protein
MSQSAACLDTGRRGDKVRIHSTAEADRRNQSEPRDLTPHTTAQPRGDGAPERVSDEFEAGQAKL